MESDKTKTGLFQDYEKLFVKLYNKPIKYLEIGVLKGGSLEWARHFFHPESRIFGVDIVFTESPEGTTIFNINQNDTDGLHKLGQLQGPFDIIIDDGSHMRKETQNTFSALHKFVAECGFYIIEDWAAGYLPHLEHCKGMETLVTDLVWKYGGEIIRNKQGGTYAIIGRGWDH